MFLLLAGRTEYTLYNVPLHGEYNGWNGVMEPMHNTENRKEVMFSKNIGRCCSSSHIHRTGIGKIQGNFTAE